MNDWKKVGLVVVASAAVVLLAGAGGRSAVRTTPEAEAHVQASHTLSIDRVATSDADADNGPGCAESALN